MNFFNKLFTLIFIALLSYSCSPDYVDNGILPTNPLPNNPVDPTNPTNPTDPTNPTNPTPQQLLVGTWKMFAIDILISYQGQVLENGSEEIPEGQQSVFVFSANGDLQITQFNEETQQFETLSGNYTFNTQNNSILCTVDGQQLPFNVTLLNTTNLSLRTQIQEEFEGMLLDLDLTTKFIRQ